MALALVVGCGSPSEDEQFNQELQRGEQIVKEAEQDLKDEGFCIDHPDWASCEEEQ